MIRTRKFNSFPSKSLPRRLFSFLALSGCLLACSADSGEAPDPSVLRLPVTRDTIISAYPSERAGNSGGAGRLKLKGWQESTLLDIDPEPLRGRVVRKARIHIRSAAPDWPLARVGVSTVASPWNEGTATGYRPQTGSACFDQAALGERDWAEPGGNLMDAVFGMGGTFWRFADATPPDVDGRQSVPVDPAVVAARVAGVSHGFLLWDEVGSEWACRNGAFEYFVFPNRFLYSRESIRSAPWMEVFLGDEDRIPPEAIPEILAETDGLPAGEAAFHWMTPPDRGPAGTIGFHARLDGPDRDMDQEVPRYQIPAAGKTGERVSMRLRNLDLSPEIRYRLRVRPVDGAGNAGPWTETRFRVSSGPPPLSVPDAAPAPFSADGAPPTVDGIRVAVLDALDKVDPVSGRILPEPPPGYRTGNHLFSAETGRIRLRAARNETADFQILLSGRVSDVSVALSLDPPEAFRTALFEFAYVRAGDRELPDPLVPIRGPISAPEPAGDRDRFAHHALVAEIHVPGDAAPGPRRGILRIESGGETLRLPVDLTVLDFALPDRLSFVPEMNAYGVASPYAGHDHYRLAHEHRLCLNRLPYGWNGRPAFAPPWDGERFDWTEWDRRVGPLLDGGAFADSPRAGQPVDVLYLPFNENWPVNLYDHYTPSYWIEEALTPAYREELGRAFAAFARHCDEKGWHRTRFQFYLNNKVYHRRQYAENSAPWIFDEPVNTQDFRALRWYARLFRESAEPVRGAARMRFRADISYFQFGRDILWGLLDETYMGGNDPQKTRMWGEMNRRLPDSALYEYGSANPVDAPNTQPVLWCLSAWAAGADGVLPWQTMGKPESWKTADATALFYPGPDGPLPSIRLKAFRRGQQDVEYLVALARVLGRDRRDVADWLRRNLPLAGSVEKSHETDAGTAVFDGTSPGDLWRLRTRIGAFLSDLSETAEPSPDAPEAFGTMPGAITRSPLPDLDPVPGLPDAETRKPDCADFSP